MDEWMVAVMKAMYEDASMKVRVNGRGRENTVFSIKVRVHQG